MRLLHQETNVQGIEALHQYNLSLNLTNILHNKKRGKSNHWLQSSIEIPAFKIKNI